MATHLQNPARKFQLISRDDAGNDVVVLDLLDEEGGCSCQGITLMGGLEELYLIKRTQVVKSAAFQEGGTLSKFPRVEVRNPKLKIATHSNSLAGWERLESLLWSVLSDRWDCYLRVYDAQNNWRELRLRRSGEPKASAPQPMGMRHWEIWDVTGISADPFWYSEELTFQITRAEMTAGPGGVYTGQVPMWNPSDNDCYPQWASNQLSAPTLWTLPDGFGVYTAKNTTDPSKIGQPVVHMIPDKDGLDVGQEFLVDTYPDEPTVRVRDGSNAWARMRAESFEFPIPPGTDTPQYRPITVKGGSSTSMVKLYLPQRWDGPFGRVIRPSL
jgi:hypothetical protein